MRRCRVLLVLLVLGCPSIAVDDDDASEDDEAVGDDDTGDDDTGDDDTGDDDSGDDDSGDDDSGDDDDSEPCWSGSDPVALFDMAAIADQSTLDYQVVSTDIVIKNIQWPPFVRSVQVSEVRYTSWQWDDCVPSPIAIEAWVAMPVDALGVVVSLPGIVKAHGLGGNADPNAAANPAAALNAVVIAYSGPGQGGSEGTGSTPDHLFDTVDDPRDSWMYEHPLAALRGLTVLETQIPEVDPARLGITGYSGGGVATYLANGVDSRIAAALPSSATGYLDLAIAATPVPGWQFDLLQSMNPPRDATSAEWAGYVQWLDPQNFLATASGPTLIVNGAQDQFFPINSTQATFAGLAAGDPATRLLTIIDFDHGPLAVNNSFAAEWANHAGRYWFEHWLGTVDSYTGEAPMPEIVQVIPWLCPVEGVPILPCAHVTVNAGSGYAVDDVVFRWSTTNAAGEGGLVWQSWNLQDEGGGLWAAEVGTLDANVWTSANAAWYAEVAYSTGLVSLDPGFRLTTEPSIPPGFSPVILEIPE